MPEVYKVLGQSQINSCGLQSVDRNSIEGQLLIKQLKAGPGEKIARDHVRRCICGEMTIIYAYTAAKVTKYCESCEFFESKQTTTGL